MRTFSSTEGDRTEGLWRPSLRVSSSSSRSDRCGARRSPSTFQSWMRSRSSMLTVPFRGISIGGVYWCPEERHVAEELEVRARDVWPGHGTAEPVRALLHLQQALAVRQQAVHSGGNRTGVLKGDDDASSV